MWTINFIPYLHMHLNFKAQESCRKILRLFHNHAAHHLLEVVNAPTTLALHCQNFQLELIDHIMSHLWLQLQTKIYEISPFFNHRVLLAPKLTNAELNAYDAFKFNLSLKHLYLLKLIQCLRYFQKTSTSNSQPLELFTHAFTENSMPTL